MVLLTGLGSGVAQLADFSRGIGRIILELICLSSILFLVLRLWRIRYVADSQRLCRDLERTARLLSTQQTRHQTYVDAIGRIIDREVPLFQDTLEVTVTVGADDDSDMIVERWHTIPRPRVTHRTVRPIVPADQDQLVRLEDIAFHSQLLGANGTITSLPLVERLDYLRVWLVFDPALTTTTDWMVEYRPRGLWHPLRQRGWDYLRWNDSLLMANGTPSSLTRFTVRFVFPKSRVTPGVTERRGWGLVESAQRIEGTGQWVIVWQDAQPSGRRYEWDLTYTADQPYPVT